MNELDIKLNTYNIKKHITKSLKRMNKKIILLIDADKTLTSVDSTKYFCKFSEIDFLNIKSIFKKYDYTFDGFYNTAKFYSNIDIDKYKTACYKSAEKVELYKDFVDFLHRIKVQADIFIITSGIKLLWSETIKLNNLEFTNLIGGNYLHEDNYIMGKNDKGMVASYLKSKGKYVISFGDSLVDYDMMLNSDKAYLIVNEKMNKDIIDLVKDIKKIEQISFNNIYHEELMITDFDNIKKLISEVENGI